MSNQIPFGLESKKTFAPLNATDLETMGKMAANRFLAGESSLNDAVIKEAREHPSISTHQVRRVVEFANQEAFARLFEKNAGDKNIEFNIADPGVVLHAMNDSARPGTITATPSEYNSAPVKLAHSDAEADLQLAREFGFDMASPHSEKTVFACVDPARGNVIDFFVKQAGHPLMDRLQMMQEQSASPEAGTLLTGDEQVPVDARQMSEEEEAQKVSGGPPDAMMPPEAYPDLMAEGQPQQEASPQTPPPAGAPEGSAAAQGPNVSPESANANDHNDRMLELQREIEFAKKRQELASIQQKMLEQMAPQPPPLPPGVQPAGSQMPAPMPPDMAAQQPPPGVPPGGEAAAPQEIPPPFAGAITAPPGSGLPKTSSALTKEALAYAKSGRPGALQVIEDLEQATSLDRIKAATAQRPQYKEHRPFGDLERTREKVAYLWREAKVAVDTNVAMTKEAMDRFVHSVEQHVLGGGNVGEVAHVLQSTPEANSYPYLTDVAVKTAMKALIDRRLDITKMKVAAIQYEQTAGGARCANPSHPIVVTFRDFCKVALAQGPLNAALDKLGSTKALVESTYQEALRHVAASNQ
jgi:hypothetical protein